MARTPVIASPCAASRKFCNSKFIFSLTCRNCPRNATLVKSAPIPKPSKKIPIPKDAFICKALRPSRCENMERHSGDEESKKVRMALLICGQDTYCPSGRKKRGVKLYYGSEKRAERR